MNSETFKLQSECLDERIRLYVNDEGFVVGVLNDKSKEYIQSGNIYDLCARARVSIDRSLAISVSRNRECIRQERINKSATQGQQVRTKELDGSPLFHMDLSRGAGLITTYGHADGLRCSILQGRGMHIHSYLYDILLSAHVDIMGHVAFHMIREEEEHV